MYGPDQVTGALPDKLRQEYLDRLTTYNPVRARASTLAITKQLADVSSQDSLRQLLRRSRPEALVHKKQQAIEKKIYQTRREAAQARNKTIGPLPSRAGSVGSGAGSSKRELNASGASARSAMGIGAEASYYTNDVERGGGFMTTSHQSEGRVALDPKLRPVNTPGPFSLPNERDPELRPSSPMRPSTPSGMQFSTSTSSRGLEAYPNKSTAQRQKKVQRDDSGVSVGYSEMLTLDGDAGSGRGGPGRKGASRGAGKKSKHWTFAQGWEKRPKPADNPLLYSFENNTSHSRNIYSRESMTLGSQQTMISSAKRYSPLMWRTSELGITPNEREGGSQISQGPIYGMQPKDSPTKMKHIDYGPSHSLVETRSCADLRFAGANRFNETKSWGSANSTAPPPTYTQTEKSRACTADLGAARHRLVVQDREFPVNRLDPSPGPIYKPGAMSRPTSQTEGWS